MFYFKAYLRLVVICCSLFFQAELLLLMLMVKMCTHSNMAASVFIDFQRGLLCEQSETNPLTIRDGSVQTLMRSQENGRV